MEAKKNAPIIAPPSSDEIDMTNVDKTMENMIEKMEEQTTESENSSTNDEDEDMADVLDALPKLERPSFLQERLAARAESEAAFEAEKKEKKR